MALNLAAALTLTGPTPTNLNQIVSNINRSVGSVNTNLNVGINPAPIRQARDLLNEAKNAAEEFGKAGGLAGRRFASFTLVAGSIFTAINAIKTATVEALQFERQMVKLEQISGETRGQLAAVASQISKLSTSLGVSSKGLADVAVTLKQAGLSAEAVNKSLEAIAKSDLAPSFDNMKSTTEGVIAIFAQFRIEAGQVEDALGSINAVANAFAVESRDIVEAVRRTGGAFRTTGGDLNEFIALFTSVRSTTRESAESIATGLRTVFTRLQRKDTVEALHDLGIELRFTKEQAEALGDVNLRDQFVGGYEAVKRLSEGLKELRGTDPRFSAVVEQLGGYRQISKVIPLLQEFGTAQKALSIAQAGQNSLTQSAEISQKAYLQRLQQTKERFLELFRTIVGSNAFQGFIETGLKLANAFTAIANALTPLIPLLTTLAAIKIGSQIAGFLGGARAGLGGASPSRLASGGVVPGHGSGDTVPALLTPGEFVIKKDSAKQIGYGNLQKANMGGRVRRYAGGGSIFNTPQDFDFATVAGQTFGLTNPSEADLERYRRLSRTPKDEIKRLAKTGDSYAQSFLDAGIETAPGVKREKLLAAIQKERSKGLINEVTNKKGEVSKRLNIPFSGDRIGLISQGDAVEAGEIGFAGGTDIINKSNKTVKEMLKRAGINKIAGSADVHVISNQASKIYKNRFEDKVKANIQTIFNSEFPNTGKAIGGFGFLDQDMSSMSGHIFEKYISGLAGTRSEGGKESFDFQSGIQNQDFKKLIFPSDLKANLIDVKLKFDKKSKERVHNVGKKYLEYAQKTGKLDAALFGGGGTNGKNDPGVFGFKFAGGGVVPGSGNGDTVPAMLEPGEFVIKKDSARSIGYGALHNVNKYGNGGVVLKPNQIASITTNEYRKEKVDLGENGKVLEALRENYTVPIDGIKRGAVKKFSGTADSYGIGGGQGDKVKTKVSDAISKLSASVVKQLGGGQKVNRIFDEEQLRENFNSNLVVGTIFEVALASIKKGSFNKGSSGQSFDFTNRIEAGDFEKIIKLDNGYNLGDATASPLNRIKSTIPGKLASYIKKNPVEAIDLFQPDAKLQYDSHLPKKNKRQENKEPVKKGYASGGGVSDTVPAMLTPGEFVINKESAAKIGASNLNRMNQSGVAHFQRGGAVQYLQGGSNSPVKDNLLKPKNDTDTDISVKIDSGDISKPIQDLHTTMKQVADSSAATSANTQKIAATNTQNAGAFTTGTTKPIDPRFLMPVDLAKSSPNLQTPQDFAGVEVANTKKGVKIGKAPKTQLATDDFSGVEVVNRRNKGVSIGPAPKTQLATSRPDISAADDDFLSRAFATIKDKPPISDNVIRGLATPQNENLQLFGQVPDIVRNGVSRPKRSDPNQFEIENEKGAGLDVLAGVKAVRAIGNNGRLSEGSQKEVADAAIAQVKKEYIDVVQRQIQAQNDNIETSERLKIAEEEYQKVLDGNSSARVDLGKGSVVGSNTFTDRRGSIISPLTPEDSRKRDEKFAGLGTLKDRETEKVVKTQFGGQASSVTTAKVSTEAEERVRKQYIDVVQRQIQAANKDIPKAERMLIAQDQYAADLLKVGSVQVNLANNTVKLSNSVAGGIRPLGRISSLLNDLAQPFIQLKTSVVAAAANFKNNPLGAVKSGISGVADRLKGAGIAGTFALSTAATYGSESLSKQAGTAENAVTREQQENFVSKSGQSGALSGAAAGALAGSILGPFGIAAGAVAGGLIGYTASIKDAEKQVRTIQLSKAFDNFSAKLNEINSSVLPATQASFAGVAQSLKTLQVATVETELKNNQPTFVGNDNFLGRFAERNLGVGKFNDEGSLATGSKNFDAQLSKDFSGLSQASERLIKSIAPQNLDQDIGGFLENFKKAGGGFGQSFIELSARVRKLPIAQIEEELKKGLLEAQRFAKAASSEKVGARDEARVVSSFVQLTQAIQLASEAFNDLDNNSRNLLSAFDGFAGQFKVNFGQNALKQFGAVNNPQLGTAIKATTAVFGPEGNDLKNQAEGFDQAQQLLPSIIAKVVGSSGALDANENISTKITDALKQAAPNIPREVLSSITRNLDKLDYTEIVSNLGKNVDDFTKELTKGSKPIQDALQAIAKQIEDNAARMLDGFGKVQQLINAIGNEKDKLGKIRLSEQRARADVVATARGRPGDGLDFLPIQAQFAPIQARQERLTGLQGANANNPNIITNKLDAVNAAIVEQQTKFNNLAKEGKSGSPEAVEAAKKLKELENASNNLIQSLKDLSDASEKNSILQERLSRVQSDRDSRVGFAERYLRGGPEEQNKLNQGVLLSFAAAFKGIDGFNKNQKNTLFDTLDSLGNAKLGAFGGISAKDYKTQLIANSSVGRSLGIQAQDSEIQQLQKAIADNLTLARVAQEALIAKQTEAQVKYATAVENAQKETNLRLERNIQATLLVAKNIELGQAIEEQKKVEKQEGQLKELDKDFGIKNEVDFARVQQNLPQLRELSDVRENKKRDEKAFATVDQALPNIVEQVVKQARPVGEQGNKRVDYENVLAQLQTQLLNKGLGGDIVNPALGNLRGDIKKEQRDTGNADININRLFELLKARLEEQKQNQAGRLGEKEQEAVRGLQGAGLTDEMINNITANFTKFAKATEGVTVQLFQKINEAVINIGATVTLLNIEIDKLKEKIQPNAAGGQIKYYSNGNSVFQPRGTDTVPAMLTPGEFVVKKSAVDTYGASFLHKINDKQLDKNQYFDKGGAVYLQGGGFGGGKFEDAVFGAFKVPTSYDKKKKKRVVDPVEPYLTIAPNRLGVGGAGLTGQGTEGEFVNRQYKPILNRFDLDQSRYSPQAQTSVRINQYIKNYNKRTGEKVPLMGGVVGEYSEEQLKVPQIANFVRNGEVARLQNAITRIGDNPNNRGADGRRTAEAQQQVNELADRIRKVRAGGKVRTFDGEGPTLPHAVNYRERIDAINKRKPRQDNLPVSDPNAIQTIANIDESYNPDVAREAARVKGKESLAEFRQRQANDEEYKRRQQKKNAQPINPDAIIERAGEKVEQEEVVNIQNGKRNRRDRLFEVPGIRDNVVLGAAGNPGPIPNDVDTFDERNEVARETAAELNEATGATQQFINDAKEKARLKKIEDEKNKAAGRVVERGLYSGGIVKFASGGSVPGFGSRDSVPSLLTPGEFVLNKTASQAIGHGNLDAVNRFASGGLVGGRPQYLAAGGSVSNSVEQMSTLLPGLNSVATALQSFASQEFITALTNFPKTLAGNFTHQVNVTLNGAEALAGIQEGLQQMVTAKVNEAIGRYHKDSTPDAPLPQNN